MRQCEHGQWGGAWLCQGCYQVLEGKAKGFTFANGRLQGLGTESEMTSSVLVICHSRCHAGMLW